MSKYSCSNQTAMVWGRGCVGIQVLSLVTVCDFELFIGSPVVVVVGGSYAKQDA